MEYVLAEIPAALFLVWVYVSNRRTAKLMQSVLDDQRAFEKAEYERVRHELAAFNRNRAEMEVDRECCARAAVEMRKLLDGGK